MAEQAFKELKSRLQCEIRHMKNKCWSEISAVIQRAYDCKDLKSLYSTMRQVFGPQLSTMVPLKSKDGSVLMKDTVGIIARWTEHFTDLFDNPSATDDFTMISGLPQKEILTEMMTDPTFDEVKFTIEEVNTGKATGLDGIPVELLRCGGDNNAEAVYTFILGVWHRDPVPQDLVDAIMLFLYKGKGSKSSCGDYRGISLLEAVRKVFSKVLSNRLIKWICPCVIPESQCGFRTGRGTMDMILSARGQLMEKFIEERVPLYQVFVYLTKAFDTVNRSGMLIILGKLGCPPQFVEMLKQLHRNMKARVNAIGSHSAPIPVKNGVKQGDIPTSTLFNIYFAVMLSYVI